MSGGRDEGGAGLLKREADGMSDPATCGLIVPDETGENRQTRGIGGSPSEGTLRVILQIPDGRGAYVPSTVGIQARAIEFIEPAIVVVQDEDVAVTGAGIRVALDVGVRRNGHGAGIAFVAVGVKEDVHRGLQSADDRIGNTHVAAMMFARAKIGVERDGRADEADVGIGVGIDGCSGDVLIPGVVGGEGAEAVESCAGTNCDAAASARLCGGSYVEIEAGGGALAGS